MLSAIASGGLFAYREFVRVAAVPLPRGDAGEVHLYFDRPGIPAYLETLITVPGFGETEIHHRIHIEDEHVEAAHFFLVIVGDARTREPYPNGQPSTRSNGCWASLWTIPDDVDLRCYIANLRPGSIYAAPGLRKSAQVISGRIKNDNMANAVVQIRTSTTAHFTEEAGKRRYFALPAIGTKYVPPTHRNAFSSDVGEGREGYVPSKLDVSVDFGELRQSDRLENVSPEPMSGELTWVEVDESLLRARGSIVDTVAEEKGQRTLFLAGIYAGIAATIAPLLISRLTRLIRRIARHKRASIARRNLCAS